MSGEFPEGRRGGEEVGGAGGKVICEIVGERVVKEGDGVGGDFGEASRGDGDGEEVPSELLEEG